MQLLFKFARSSVLCCLSIALQLTIAYASERIVLLDSAITVQQDGSLNVQELITIQAEGDRIKRGITRSFPTIYKDRFGNQVIIDFSISTIQQDGLPTPFEVTSYANGKIIKIGDPNKFLLPGKHTYLLSYTVNRELGFFKSHDEFAWNVTGADVPFVIEKIKAHINFPTNLPLDLVTIEKSATGRFGERGENYTAFKDSTGVHFETTKALQPGELFTIIVSWPKGYITEPNLVTKFLWFIKDNIFSLWSFLGMLLLLIFYVLTWLKERKFQRPGVIIPLFEPPKNLLPGSVRFIMNKKYDDKIFASELVNMAVNNLLTINYTSKLFQKFYTLIKNKDQPTHGKQSAEAAKHKVESIEPVYQEVLNALFRTANKLELTPPNKDIIDRAQTRYLTHAPLGYNYIKNNSEYKGVGLFLSFLALIPLLYSVIFYQIGSDLLLLLSGIAGICFFIYSKLITGYTLAGRKLMDQIEGFKMFLATTETERLKIIGTPPTKTPELYEKYLPYAMALGVEQQWSKQFAPIFARLKAEHKFDRFSWFNGDPSLLILNTSSFTNNVARAVQLPISSSTYSPGSQSSSGGRGSSGSGGGGGGIGGW